jgi:Family of unknown function (DUF6364)
MNTKLTLRLEEELIKSAKQHASVMGKSVSQMVADYFYLLDKKTLKKPISLTPLVKSLKGSLKKSDIDESYYQSHLEDKYL